MRISYKYSSSTIYSVFCPADSEDLGLYSELVREDEDQEFLEEYGLAYNYSSSIGETN